MNSFIKAIQKEEKEYYEKGVKVSYEKLKNLVSYLNDNFNDKIAEEVKKKLEDMKKKVEEIQNKAEEVRKNFETAAPVEGDNGNKNNFDKGIKGLQDLNKKIKDAGLDGTLFDFFKKYNLVNGAIGEKFDIKGNDNSTTDAEDSTTNVDVATNTSESAKMGPEDCSVTITIPDYKDKELKFTFKKDGKASSGIKSVEFAGDTSEAAKEDKNKNSKKGIEIPKGTEISKGTDSATKTETEKKDFEIECISNKIGLFNKIKNDCYEVTRRNCENMIKEIRKTFYEGEKSINTQLIELKEKYEDYKEKQDLVVNENAKKPEIAVESVYNDNKKDGNGEHWSEYMKSVDDNVKPVKEKKQTGNKKKDDREQAKTNKKKAERGEKVKEKQDEKAEDIKNYIRNFLEELESMSEDTGISFEYEDKVDEIEEKLDPEAKKKKDEEQAETEGDESAKKEDELLYEEDKSEIGDIRGNSQSNSQETSSEVELKEIKTEENSKFTFTIKGGEVKAEQSEEETANEEKKDDAEGEEASGLTEIKIDSIIDAIGLRYASDLGKNKEEKNYITFMSGKEFEDKKWELGEDVADDVPGAGEVSREDEIQAAVDSNGGAD